MPGYVAYGPTLASGAPADAGAFLLAAVANASPAGLLWAPDAGSSRAPPGAVAVAAPSTTGFLPLDDVGGLDALRERMRGTWRRDLDRAERHADLSLAWDDAGRVAADLMPRVAELARLRAFRAPASPGVVAAFARDAARDGIDVLAARVLRAGDAAPVALGMAAVGGRTARTLWLWGDPERAPGAGRLLLWAFLRRAREAGATSYDLAGIDPEGNPGVASFKAGLRPDLVEVPGMRWLPPRGRAGSLLAPVVRPLVEARLARATGSASA
jgi:hypothetical protein